MVAVKVGEAKQMAEVVAKPEARAKTAASSAASPAVNTQTAAIVADPKGALPAAARQPRESRPAPVPQSTEVEVTRVWPSQKGAYRWVSRRLPLPCRTLC